MFTDAQYQPHSSSVRVTALAAMSPATPTHLALPPQRGGVVVGALEGGEHFLSGVLMEDVERSPCAFTQSKQRAAVRLFIY